MRQGQANGDCGLAPNGANSARDGCRSGKWKEMRLEQSSCVWTLAEVNGFKVHLEASGWRRAASGGDELCYDVTLHLSIRTLSLVRGVNGIVEGV